MLLALQIKLGMIRILFLICLRFVGLMGLLRIQLNLEFKFQKVANINSKSLFFIQVVYHRLNNNN